MARTVGTAEHLNAGTLVDRQVEAGRGETLAVVAADAALTYDQLRRQINRAGSLLRELGVRREQRVLLVLDDTTMFPTVFLGALRIGAVPVPVSPLDKADNFRHFVEDSYAELVVTDAQHLPRLTEALAGHQIRWLARDGSGPGVTELDGAPRRAAGRARGAGHPSRRHGVLALQLGLNRQAEGRRPSAPRHRGHLPQLRRGDAGTCGPRT